jgi:hypothetical protein
MPHINPIKHVLLYCGIPVDQSLTEGNAKQVLSQKKDEQDGKIAQMKYKLNDFVDDISDSFTTIEGNPHYKKTINNKLKDRIIKRETKESQWGIIHRFFHRLGHLIRGHGFNTTAERAKMIQNRLEKDAGTTLKIEETAKPKPNVEELVPKQVIEKKYKPVEDLVSNTDENKPKQEVSFSKEAKADEEVVANQDTEK